MNFDLNPWLSAAGVAAAFAALIHFFAGGREIARPLLEAGDIAPIPKYTNYYCWHLVTIILIAMSAGFFYAAWDPHSVGLSVTWTLVAAAFAIWSLGLSMWKGLSPLEMLQWVFFVPIVLFGLVGIMY
ncbi:MAG: hypothetical protein K0U74_13515 [Alphaproteobacteria bacterium]|nr:hypothetical protein [Alphaproteobacteria bacterium]